MQAPCCTIPAQHAPAMPTIPLPPPFPNGRTFCYLDTLKWAERGGKAKEREATGSCDKRCETGWPRLGKRLGSGNAAVTKPVQQQLALRGYNGTIQWSRTVAVGGANSPSSAGLGVRWGGVEGSETKRFVYQKIPRKIDDKNPGDHQKQSQAQAKATAAIPADWIKGQGISGAIAMPCIITSATATADG